VAYGGQEKLKKDTTALKGLFNDRVNVRKSRNKNRGSRLIRRGKEVGEEG
jgi:hypothetical protein